MRKAIIVNRLILTMCVCGAWFAGFQARAASPALGGKIIVSANAGTELRACAQDLAATLHRMTGRNFTLTDSGTVGIVLATTGSPLAPPQAMTKLKDAGREPFWICAEGSKRLWLIANDELGVEHGLYWYLQQLGCRWFLPNEDFTYIPKRQDIVPTINKVIKPAFIRRTYFGSGGFGPINPVDPGEQVPGSWNTWNRRNLFGAEYNPGGHDWDGFIARHQKDFDAHPEYYALQKGQRGGVKLCVTNPDVAKLYIDDCLANLRAAGGNIPVISIEPSDGSGYCECPECAKLGKPEEVNQVFYFANKMAKAIGAEFPKTRLSLYAYGMHSALPNFALEPNLLVQVVPYGFNFSDLSPEELIHAWAQKVKHLHLYDYWSITDWSQNLPDDNVLCGIGAQKMPYWRRQGVEGVLLESTYSAAGAGLSLYVYSRVMWAPNTDVKALLNEFFTLSFGKAAPPMRRMMERWAHGFHLDRIELGNTYADLAEARRLAGTDPAVLKRVADYAMYAQYMRLRHEWTGAAPNEQARLTPDYLRCMWRQLPEMMMHPYRFTQIIMWKEPDGPNVEKMLGFNNGQFVDKNTGFWKSLTPITRDEAFGWIDAGAKAYPPLHVERTFSDRLVPLVPVKPGQTPTGQYGPVLFLDHTNLIEFEVPPGVTQLTFKIKVSRSQNVFTMQGMSGKVLRQEKIPADTEREIVQQFPAPGRYLLNYDANSTGGWIQVPRGLPLTFRQVSVATLSPPMYFYVPRGTRTVYLKGIVIKEYFKVLDPQGQVVPCTFNDVTTFDVPAGMDGKVWSTQLFEGSLTGINIPWLLAFSPNELLLPVDLLPELPGTK